jgi:hypothetical protein
LLMPTVSASGGNSPDATPLRHISGGMRKKGRQVVVKVVSFDTSLGFAAASARSRFFFPTKHHGQTMSETTSMDIVLAAAIARDAKSRDVTACDVASSAFFFSREPRFSGLFRC